MTSPCFETLEAVFDWAWPAQQWRGTHVVLAVSGGADSVAMLRAALRLKASAGGAGRLFVAHLNHELRSRDSEQDAAWVKSLCGRLNVPVEIGTAPVAEIARERGDGLEEAARAARYEFLRQTAERLGARFVATAHTADDQIETVLHRILRGTGIAGLQGIPRARPLSASVSLIRPLLAVRREAVLEYLSNLGQDYRTDASNTDLRQTRNRIRLELLPMLRTYCDGDLDASLLRVASQAAETQALIAMTAAVWVERAVVATRTATGEARVEIACAVLDGQPPLVVREVCKAAWQQAGWPRQAMGFDEWQTLASLIADYPGGKTANLPGNVHARREGGRLILTAGGLP